MTDKTPLAGNDTYQNAATTFAVAEIANLHSLVTGMDKAKPEQRVRDLRKAIAISKLIATTLQRLK